MPAVTPPARKPGTAVMPPSSHSISAINFPGGPDMAPRPPTLGRAPAPPWRASGSTQGVSCRSGIHRRGVEPGALVPPLEDVQALHAVGRAALAQVVDGGHAHGAAGA